MNNLFENLARFFLLFFAKRLGGERIPIWRPRPAVDPLKTRPKAEM